MPRNNNDDRELGKLWEKNFCDLANWYGKAFFAIQIGRTGAATWSQGNRAQLLPDITIYQSPCEHHEIKHKNPTAPSRFRERRYGYEAYRVYHLVKFHKTCEQPVFYTVHDWELTLSQIPTVGVRSSGIWMPNALQHWRTVDFTVLLATMQQTTPEHFDTYVNGEMTKRPGFYWPITLWQGLDEVWGLPR